MADRVQTRPVSPPPLPFDGVRTGTAEPHLGELFRQLAEDSATLVRQEMALAKAELRANAKSMARDVAMIAVGGAVAAVGALVLVAFLVLVLGAVIGSYWASALIVGLLFVVVGAIMAIGAKKRLKTDGLAPDQTLQTLKEDKQWLQSEIRQARQDLA